MELIRTLHAGQLEATAVVRELVIAVRAPGESPREGAEGERRAEVGKPRRMKVTPRRAAGGLVAVERAGGRVDLEDKGVGVRVREAVRVAVRVGDLVAEPVGEGEEGGIESWQAEPPTGKK